MASLFAVVDPYADTLELPVSGDFDAVSATWERDQVLTHLGNQYQVVREIGRGGMGVVFLARDIALHRLVAIKVLRYEFASSEDHRERFRREARMTARLGHPNIVPVFSFGVIEEFTYIVMKYVHGVSLAERMRRERRLPAGEVRRILRDLALALDSAHRDGVIHRDLKAENILLDGAGGHAMVTDFGVALQRSLDPVRAEIGQAFGTPHYMSPEQAAGELDIDGRSDVYSLGVLGYYMVTGRLPFDARTFEALAAKHIAELPAPITDVSTDSPVLNAAIERCLAKARDDRFDTAAALAEALDVKPPQRRWLRRASTATKMVFRHRFGAELAVLAALARAVMRATTI